MGGVFETLQSKLAEFVEHAGNLDSLIDDWTEKDNLEDRRQDLNAAEVEILSGLIDEIFSELYDAHSALGNVAQSGYPPDYFEGSDEGGFNEDGYVVWKEEGEEEDEDDEDEPYLQGRMERLKAEARNQESAKRSEARDSRISSREYFQAARTTLALRMGWDGEVERQLGGYSNDMRTILRREREHLEDHESFVRIDDAYYVRSETSEGDVIGHKTLDAWRAERTLVKNTTNDKRSNASVQNITRQLAG